MVREHGEAEAASIVEEFAGQMRAIAEASHKRAQLTATGTASSGRVVVTVNADMIVIATRFSSAIDDLTSDEIAKAVTTAAQNAAAEMGRKAADLMKPLTDQRARMPKLSDLFEGMPDLITEAPLTTPASLAAPNSRERLAATAEPAPEFDGALDYEAWQSTKSGGATDREW
ncbi:YbaB/EbfC family nucleoid-associated protein [Nocardia sp. NPDC057668]|uniref:YbaB/EbfC family nucleoid-associated protein n=1 Tax=Nocardia sp. NPDC057668 TaxID=3346202 RepID=UPI00366B2552